MEVKRATFGTYENMEIASFGSSLSATKRSSIKPLASSIQEQYQYSNRRTYEILEPLVSYRKQSQGDDSNRHKNTLDPR